MRYCPACGSLLDSDVEICPSCGARATTVDARPEREEPKEVEEVSIEEPPSPLRRYLLPIVASAVIMIAILLFFLAHRRRAEEIQDQSRPVLALLRANQERCVQLDKEIRSLCTLAQEQVDIEPIGLYLIGEGSLELAEIEASLEILDEISSVFTGEEAAPFEAVRNLMVAHSDFCRFLIDQPDGQPDLFAARSDAHLEEIQVRKSEASSLVSLLRTQEGDLVYPYQDRISEARNQALTYLLEEEDRRTEAAFQEIEAADARDMEMRIQAVEDYENLKAGLGSRDDRLRGRVATDRTIGPLVERPTAGLLPTGEEATEEELVLAAETRLWQPRVEEATRRARAISARLRKMIRDKAFPPDMYGECEKLLAAVAQIPKDRFFPAPESFLDKATHTAIDSWRVAAEQCLEENLFALDSNLVTGDETWVQVQDRVRELTAVER